MNTEPPEGDDLQRMLVSMKRNVLERAAPRPRRRRGRSGLVIGVVALLAVGTATGAVALTLAQQDEPVAAPVQTQEPEPAPSDEPPTSAPITATPKPEPTGNAAATVARIPDTCRATVSADAYTRIFGDREAMDVLAGFDAADRQGSSGVTERYCLWGASDGPGPGLALTIGTGTPDQMATGEEIFFDGWEPSCEDSDGIRLCRASTTESDGSVTARTRYERGGVWIEIDQGDFPTNGLLPAVIGQVWGD